MKERFRNAWPYILGCAVGLAAILLLMAVGSSVNAADRWEISLSGDRVDYIRSDGYFEIYGEDDSILFRETWTDELNHIVHLPELLQVQNGVRIEYGLRPSVTSLILPSEISAGLSGQYLIYCSGSLVSELRDSSTQPLHSLMIHSVNYLSNNLQVSIGTPAVETPAEYTPGYSVPVQFGESSYSSSSVRFQYTIPYSTGYFGGGRDITVPPRIIGDSGWQRTALDVSYITDSFTVHYIGSSTHFKYGYFQPDHPDTIVPETTLSPVPTLPVPSDTNLYPLWQDAFDNDFAALFIVPAIITLLTVALVGFVIFGQRE